MLAITSKSPYAVRALCELAQCGKPCPVPIGELAKRRDIPVQFLEGLFANLRRAGILTSQRGVKGGYQFARPPDEITILEVVEVLEGELKADPPDEIWIDTVAAIREVLASTTIAELADREAPAAGAGMYYI